MKDKECCLGSVEIKGVLAGIRRLELLLGPVDGSFFLFAESFKKYTFPKCMNLRGWCAAKNPTIREIRSEKVDILQCCLDIEGEKGVIRMLGVP